MTGKLEMLLDVLRATAQEGLSYPANDYDRARYQKLLALASEEYASITSLEAERIREMFLREQGAITPKVGVDVAIPNRKGEILVLKTHAGQWCLPGGWADVGEAPFDTARRETREETGLEVNPLGYIAVGHRTAQTYPGSVSQINICVGVEPVPDEAAVTVSHEHSDYRWIAGPDDIGDWRSGHKRFFTHILRAYRERAFFPVIND